MYFEITALPALFASLEKQVIWSFDLTMSLYIKQGTVPGTVELHYESSGALKTVPVSLNTKYLVVIDFNAQSIKIDTSKIEPSGVTSNLVSDPLHLGSFLI